MEAPSLSNLYEQYKDAGLVILSISADNVSRERVKKFATTLSLSQPVLILGTEVAISKYSLKRWPSNVYINRRGEIVGHDFDYRGARHLKEWVDKLLK